MAVSLPDVARARITAALLCCAAAVAVPGAVGAAGSIELPRPSKDQPIDLVAASSDVDYKNNTLRFRQLVVTQGPLRVEAQEATATGLDFAKSDWTLTGQVRITMPDGKLTADDAKLPFRNNQVAQATAHGAPAEFEHKLKDSPQVVKGHADTIDYDVLAGTVRLSGAGWLTDGDNVIRGDTLVYSLATQRVQANPDSVVPGGVHITINPKSQDKPDAKAADQPKGKPDAHP
jgi:lipopolysaccharide export system protein LptA